MNRILCQLPILILLLFNTCIDPSDDGGEYPEYPQNIVLTQTGVNSIVHGNAYFETISLTNPTTGQTVSTEIAQSDTTRLTLDWLTFKTIDGYNTLWLSAAPTEQPDDIVIEGRVIPMQGKKTPRTQTITVAFRPAEP